MADEIPPRNVYSDADRHQQPHEEGHKLLSARTHPRSRVIEQISSQIGSRSNRPQSNRPPSQNGLKIKVKSATYFKLNKKKYVLI
jgi:hypothetical protein